MIDSEILLKLKRLYSKDETVKLLNDELAKVCFRIGELMSENAELKDTNDSLKKEIKKLNQELSKPKNKLTKEDLLDERIVELTKQIQSMQKKNKKLSDDVNTWRDRYCHLNATKKFLIQKQIV